MQACPTISAPVTCTRQLKSTAYARATRKHMLLLCMLLCTVVPCTICLSTWAGGAQATMLLAAQPWPAPATHLDAHRLQVSLIPHLTDAARSSQQGLGGNAATVHAGATNVVALNDCNLHALQDGTAGNRGTHAHGSAHPRTHQHHPALSSQQQEGIKIQSGFGGAMAFDQQHFPKWCCTQFVQCQTVLRLYSAPWSDSASWARGAADKSKCAAEEFCNTAAYSSCRLSWSLLCQSG